MTVLDRETFARWFGVASNALPAYALDKIDAADLRYRRPTPAERDAIVLRILKRLSQGSQSMLDAARRGLWADVWSAQHAKAASGGFSAASLEPAFVSGDAVVRIDGEFALPASPRLELDVYAIVRRILFHQWVGKARAAFEFGSGSAFNLEDLALMYPALEITGLDWAPAAVKLVDDMARHRGFKMQGRAFDFFAPDDSLVVPEGAAVFTFCALEQVGAQFEPFVDFLMRKRPGVCVHLEPILEFYRPEQNLADHLAVAFHRARHYLTGFHTHLGAMAQAGRIRILDERRLGFGSLFHEGYSVIVWQPV